MVLSLVARNELAVGISGAGLSGPAYRVGGLRGEARQEIYGRLDRRRASFEATALAASSG